METQTVMKQLQNGRVQSKRPRVRTSCQYCHRRFKASGVNIHEYYCRKNPKNTDEEYEGKPTRRVFRPNPKKARSKESDNSTWAKLHVEMMVRQFGWRILSVESNCLIVRVPQE